MEEKDPIERVKEEIDQKILKHIEENARILNAIDEVITLHNEKIRQDERQKIWDEINSHINGGSLSGNGFDETATRNGLVWATNIVMEGIKNCELEVGQLKRFTIKHGSRGGS